MKKILHLANDDKFIDVALPYFDKVAPNRNDLIIYSHNHQLTYVKSKAFIIHDTKNIKQNIDLSNYNIVVIHALSQDWFKFIRSIPSSITVIWLGWGYDYYDLIPIKQTLKDTNNLTSSPPQKKAVIQRLKKIIRNAKFISRKKRAINRINYFAPVLDNEYKILKDALSPFRLPEKISFTYGSMEQDFIPFPDKSISTNGNNVLVGNSATSSNNHLETLNFLKKNISDQRRIVCPLSYGNSDYGKLIIDKGLEYFDENFIPLIKFMPATDYVNTLQSCSHVIMNHVRQQALGNIIIMLYLGATVFLREENPIYPYLKSLGINLHSIQELENTPSLLQTDLSKDARKYNRKILMDIYSYQNTLLKVQNIINLQKNS